MLTRSKKLKKSNRKIPQIKHPSKAKLRKELIDLAKLYAKIRDNYKCQHCGKIVEKSNAHGSHVVPVSAGGSLPFDPMNIKCLCYHCHINWWHKNPTESGDWFKQKFPDRWKYIELHKTDEIHWKWFDYSIRIDEMKKEIDKLAPGAYV